MEAFTSAIDYLSAPPRFFALMLALFLTCRSTRLPWSRVGGWVILSVTLVFLSLGLSHDGHRGLILHPERLPVVILVLSSLTVIWFEMRRFQRDPTDAPIEARERREDDSGFSSRDGIAATVVGLFLVALVLLQPAELGPEADPSTPPDLVKVPWFFVGLQELNTYFDPWVPYFALPLLLVGGLLALPYLETGDAGSGRRRALFLLGWLLLWLWPMTVGALLRGPSWNAFGPFEAWDPSLPPPPDPQPLSEIFWVVWLGGFQPSGWWVRELPGFLLLAVYFVLLPLALRWWAPTRNAFSSYLKAMGPWRFRAAMAWVLAVMIVPLKMYGQWLWGIGYWIHLPEISFNF